MASGFTPMAPVSGRAAYLFERSLFLRHIEYRWTFADYDAAPAGDIAFEREFWAMTAPRISERAGE